MLMECRHTAIIQTKEGQTKCLLCGAVLLQEKPAEEKPTEEAPKRTTRKKTR